MDLQHPSSTAPAGKEDLSSLLFESTTTLPSLSPLSPDYPKEHTATIAFSADSTTPEALQRYSTATDYSEGKDYKYTFGLGGVEDVIFSDRGYAVEHPTSQLESASVDQAKLYTQSAKEMFSGMLQSVGPPHEAFSDLKEAVDEHYADFKPLVSTVGYDFKDMALDFKSDVSHLNFESIKPEGKYIEEKDLDLSDDISPASPDAISNSSSYETLAPLQKAAPLAYGGNPFTDNKSEKGVDGTETCSTSHLGSNVATVNPFLERIDKEAGYITSSNESGIVGAQASSKAEGLTPDIVQEAYESEVYDLGIPKLNYEPKIDLVQTTAKASQEIAPPTQNSPLFEDSNSVSSPVLPDIVMEAPLTSASQPNFSPAGHVGVVSEEKIKFESEKPPSYEDATNKSSLKEQVTTVAHVEPVKGVQAVEAEAPYISIACDLIKETIPEKVTDFSKALKNEFDSQYTAHYDESSPESEPSEPSYKHWKAEVISKEEVASIGNMKSHDIFEKDQESDQEEAVNKAYVETGSGFFESNLLAKEPVAQISSSQEKPLQMEAFGKTLYFEEVPPFREPVIFEKMTSKKEQESDQKWPEEVVHKAYAETASYGFDKNMLAKEPVKPLSSQEKPLQMEAFGKAVFSEGAPPATEPVHFEKPSAVSFVQEFSKPSKEDQVEVKKQEDLVPKDEPKKTEDLQQKAKESPPASDKLLDFSKGKSEIEDTISKPAPPTKGADVISSSTDKKQPPALPALGVCSYKTSGNQLYTLQYKSYGMILTFYYFSMFVI